MKTLIPWYRTRGISAKWYTKIPLSDVRKSKIVAFLTPVRYSKGEFEWKTYVIWPAWDKAEDMKTGVSKNADSAKLAAEKAIKETMVKYGGFDGMDKNG